MILALPNRLPSPEPLYVGIDVGKAAHVAAFSNKTLLSTRNFRDCPTFPFSHSRSGFEALLHEIGNFADPAGCTVLVEKTGRYHDALVQYLQEQGITVYVTAMRVKARHKTDKSDAQSLSLRIYNMLGLGVQTERTDNPIHRLEEATPLARYLQTLVLRRYALNREITSRKNQLTAICDQLFPELTQVFHDPNRPTALAIRQAFPTAAAVAAAPYAQVRAFVVSRPGAKGVQRLQELAASSIGMRDAGRLAGLILAQDQLISELALLEQHQSRLDTLIREAIAGSREGAILLSTGILTPLHAATLLASIGSIANFRSKSTLKAFCGWAPQTQQSGATLDKTTLKRGGNWACKQALYMSAWNAIGSDTPFRAIYERLVQRQCAFDVKRGKHRGKNKVVARIAGQIAGLAWSLLRADYDLIHRLQPGDVLPAPGLYDRARHEREIHRRGLRRV